MKYLQTAYKTLLSKTEFLPSHLLSLQIRLEDDVASSLPSHCSIQIIGHRFEELA